MTYRKKLIEVALPLDAINRESAREKSIRHGHPSTLHLWWARRPLAACRAVLFASLIDDPDQPEVPAALLARIDALRKPEKPSDEWAKLAIGEQRRERLFAFIEQLVKWENSNDESTLTTARELILAATDGNPPPVLDPFCGGGSIPLEAQRLGLEAHASDLNPVAVLITKALIEIPPKFANRPPVNPKDRAALVKGTWKGAAGLAADVRYYGQWMRDEAERRIGHLYPKIEVGAPPGIRAASPPRLPPDPLLQGEPSLSIAMARGKPGTMGAERPRPDLVTPLHRSGEGLGVRQPRAGEVHSDLAPEPSPVGLNFAQRRELCRQLRQRQTPAEDFLWELLRGRRFEGLTFRRQHPIGGFVADFCCLDHRLVVELDGGVHADPEQAARDQARDEELTRAGFQVLRLGNNAVLDDPEAALGRIRDCLSAGADSLAPAPGCLTPNPSPLRWRGEDGDGGRFAPPSGSNHPSPPQWRGAGGEAAHPATVIAWLWARTVKCPNPACGAQMPLVRSFWLSTKKGKETWVEPIVDRAAKTVRFEVRTGQGKPPDPPKIGRGANFRCLVCGQIADDQHVKTEGAAGRMGAQMLAIVAEGSHGRVYLPAAEEHELAAQATKPAYAPSEALANDPRNLWCIPYGLRTFGDLFTPRQLVALTTFSDLVAEARERARADAMAAGLPDDGVPLNDGGTGASGYGDAVATYLAMGVSRLSDICNSLCRWENTKTQVRNLFTRQAIPMVWDYAEPNVFSETAGDYETSLRNLSKVIDTNRSDGCGRAVQLDATIGIDAVSQPLVCTDPPYYDNIGYADLSDFFYVWLRRSLGQTFPRLFSTLLTPKAPELIASPYRFGGDAGKAKDFFEAGLGNTFTRMRSAQNPNYPLTVFYAFKQSEATDDAGENGSALVASTGWETMLEGLLKANFTITGTWPMRSELGNRMLASGTNALASSIVLVCRPRPSDAPLATRREFLTALKRELPDALRKLQRGNIAPVDLAQAAIGPGMAVFSRYAKVLESDGSAMRVRTALQLINQALGEILAEQEGEYDAETRWAVAWFEQYGTSEGPYGVAQTLSTAKNCSVEGLARAGLVEARGGKVRLRRRDELADDWDPATAHRVTVWEVTQRLVRALQQDGEAAAADLLAAIGSGTGETARDLAYWLYAIAERKGWPPEAFAYNSLVVAWTEITRLAAKGTPTMERLV